MRALPRNPSPSVHTPLAHQRMAQSGDGRVTRRVTDFGAIPEPAVVIPGLRLSPPECPVYDANLDARERTYWEATEGTGIRERDEGSGVRHGESSPSPLTPLPSPPPSILYEYLDEDRVYDREELGTVLCWVLAAIADRVIAAVKNVKRYALWALRSIYG